MVPWMLVSPGNTSCAVSTREARGESGGGLSISIPGLAVTRDAVGVKRVVSSFSSRARPVTLVLLGVASALVPLAWPRATLARGYHLAEVLELARRLNPGLAAGAQQTVAIEAQLAQAHRSWMPSGELLSLLAPAPEILCQPDPNVDPQSLPRSFREDHCTRTNISEASINIRGVFTRTELRLVQPVYTFGKISAGVSAAESGIAASRSREHGLAAELELNVRKAYWGIKLAREILETIKDGTEHLDSATAQIDKQLSSGKGSATPIDRYRLQTVRAEVDSRRLEAQKLARTAESGLRALVGPEAPADLDVDSEPLEAPKTTVRPLAAYEEQARLSRPEVQALSHLLTSKRALADFERRKQYPDVVLLGTATFAFANSVDNPRNAFANDPFNTLSAGLAAALRMPLDLGVRNARARQVQAEAEEAYHRRREALGGITFEVERAHADLVEAQERLKVVQQGEKAGQRWVTTVSQNFAAGLAETKDFSDALVASFTFRIRTLQSIYDLNVAAATLARAVGSSDLGQ
jgi:outer membrane protein TolC